MPTGRCNFPQHHSSGSGGAGAWVAAMAAGALILVFWHAVLVTLAVVAALAVAGVLVVMLVHSHRAEPYDASWSDVEPQDAPRLTVTVHPLAARVAELEQQLAERRQVEAPQQHLHLHGVSADEIAVALARHNHQQPAIEENQ